MSRGPLIYYTASLHSHFAKGMFCWHLVKFNSAKKKKNVKDP